MQLRLAERLARAGERHDVHWLVYNPFQFRWFHRTAKPNQDGVVDALTTTFPECRSWLDVGAGAGTFAAGLARRGYRVQALEHGFFGRVYAAFQRVRSRPFDLAKPFPEIKHPVDVAYCFEIGEHMPPELGGRLIEFLSKFDRVAFTAAHPGQGGVGHINEQPKSYWIERFDRHGMGLDSVLTARLEDGFRRADVSDWFVDNAMVFTRTAAD